jgi:DNA-binding CsgD family transcriptional regulator
MSCLALPFEFLNPSTHISVSLDTIFSPVPGHAYVKNTEGLYLWCNEKQAQVLSLQERNLILGKSVYDLCDSSTADFLEYNDALTINAREEKQFVERACFNNGQKVTVVSAKKPLINKEGEVIGIFGSSFMIPQMSDEEKISLLIQQGLAPKEAQSLFYFVNGETSKEIARRFDLSFRTIEKYLENVKIKLNIFNRAQLFEFVNQICQSGW